MTGGLSKMLKLNLKLVFEYESEAIKISVKFFVKFFSFIINLESYVYPVSVKL